MSDQLLFGDVYQQSAQACIVDLVPPTFVGIASLVANDDGSLSGAWLIATEALSNPPRYRIYIKENTATGLFSFGNIAKEVYDLSARVYTLPLGTLLEKGHTYYVGVRAVDKVGNEDSNTLSLLAISNGIVSADIATVTNTLAALLIGLGGGVQGVVNDGEAIAGVVTDEGPIEGVVDCS